MPFCVRSLFTTFSTSTFGTTVSEDPCRIRPEAGQGARKLKSYMLVGGETLITDDADRELARFTLLDRLDAALVDDTRVKHGVTPVGPADPALPSCRDVLVLTWRAGLPPG